MHLRSALRQLRTYPIESALIIIALAVGIGALSAVATLYGVNDEITKRLRADITSRQFTIVPATADNFSSLNTETLITPVRQNQRTNLLFTPDDLRSLKELAPGVDHIYNRYPRSWAPASRSRNAGTVDALAVSSDYTALADVPVAQGSWFSQEDFDLGRRVIVITERHLNELGITGDPIGQEIPMNYADMAGAPFTIIGVLPPGETIQGMGPGSFPVIGYVPFSETSPTNMFYAVVDDTRQIETAGEELRQAVQRIWGEEAVVRPPASLWQVTNAERNRALLLAGFASIGLLMASLTITNLMMARVRRRARSISIQRSLGANTTYLRSQVLTEAALLGLIGGILGIVPAQLLLRAMVSLAAPGVVELIETASLPPSAIVVTLIASIAVTTIIGLAPAARVVRTPSVPNTTNAIDLAPNLPKPMRRNPTRLVLTALQLVISGAAIVIGLHVLTLNASARPEVSVFEIEAMGGPEGNARITQPVFTQSDLPALQALAPSVEGLSISNGDYYRGYATAEGLEYAVARIQRVGPEYMELIGAELIAGSPLSGTANPATQRELLLEQSVAEQVFTSVEAAIGSTFNLRANHVARGHNRDDHQYRIVGVYAYNNPNHAYGTPEKVPALANPRVGGSSSLLAAAPRDKATAAMEELAAAARAHYGTTVTRPNIGTYDLHFITQEVWGHGQIENTLNQANFIFTLMAIVAIILAAVGSFSLSVLNAAERTTDIGVRRAIGASRSQVSLELAGSAAVIAAVATVTGILMAWLASPALSAALSESLLSGIQVPRHLSLALATLALVLTTSALLGWIVGHRATRANPSTILSEDGV